LTSALRDGKIAIIEEEAEPVRFIFRKSLELGGVRALERTSAHAISAPRSDH
jgi:hypothetical protein